MKHPLQLLRDQKGQIFMGFILGLLIIVGIMATVMGSLKYRRKYNETRNNQNYAMMVAQMGFEDALSFFRRQPDGVSMISVDPVNSPVSQAWANPWPWNPDAAFTPHASDTDHFNVISMAATASTATGFIAPTYTAMAIIRTFPLSTVSSLTTTVQEAKASRLWGRWVIRRQNLRNWSPGPNTMNAFNDPEAAHDLTHIRTRSQPGSGNLWSIVARGYVIQVPAGTTLTSYFENTAMFDGGSFINAPKRSYLNKPFLLATAKVYGELSRINFNDQKSAIWTSSGSVVTANTNGIIAGGSAGAGVAGGDATTYVTVGTPSVTGNPAYSNVGYAPSVSKVFPGQTATDLRTLADKKGTISIFPAADSLTLTTTASVPTFYYLDASTTFLAGANANVMTGVGMVYVNGNLTLNAGSLSTWSGIVFVNGNVSLRGPAEISGILIATGTVTVGNAADINKASVSYNQNALDTAKGFLQSFKVNKDSIIVSNN